MDIVSCAKNILTGCMDVKPEENVLIVRMTTNLP